MMEAGDTRTLLVDNYDSFTYNLAQYLAVLGGEVTVMRNDGTDLEGIRRLAPTHVVISPGPGGPDEAGISCELVRELAGELPILGVCLGHQVIGRVMGGEVVRGPAPVHGKTCRISHDGRTIFSGLPPGFEVGRYHSLVVDRGSLPACLEVSCEAEDGLVMGVRHRSLPLEGVQFHPESILSEYGMEMLANFLMMSGGVRGARPLRRDATGGGRDA